MSDKSFGDHTNRNILKNPLLSTAVTGLSIEDLTHNAVLMPVSRSQEVITRPDQQIGSQSTTLGHTDHAVTNLQSGDTNSYPNLPPSTFPTPPPNSKTISNVERPSSTQSKASSKSKDDFDVNEYFARLHGTRYVSAPINSMLKEDNNPNLEATEENLEEINLNEPEKMVEQQSLTSDIAQNFSQLPTVLPQMASAVFSSFSNMLQTRKSREPTPEARTGGYQEVQFERTPEPIVEYAPPVSAPKEPPTVPPTAGTASYRLPTKKKYAQIPGLSTGDSAHIPLQPPNLNMPPVSQTMPQYFVPTDIGQSQISLNAPLISQSYVPPSTTSLSQITSPLSQFTTPLSQITTPLSQITTPLSQHTTPLSQNVPPSSHSTQPILSEAAAPYFVPKLDAPSTSISHGQLSQPTNQNIPSRAPELYVPSEYGLKQFDIDSSSINQGTSIGGQNIPTDVAITRSSNNDMTKTNDNIDFKTDQTTPLNFVQTFSNEEIQLHKEEKINKDTYASNIPQPDDGLKQQQNIDNYFQSYSPSPNQVLPPPPTFANVKRDNQPGVGKSILPPSVARRISSKHTPQMTSYSANIFVPAPLTDTDKADFANVSSASQSAFAPSASTNIPPQAPFTSANLPQSTTNLATLQISSASRYPSEVLPRVEKPTESFGSAIIPPPSIFTPLFSASDLDSSTDTSKGIPPPLSSSFDSSTLVMSSAGAVVPNIAPPPFFTPSSQNTVQLQPSIFAPSQLVSSQDTTASSSINPPPTMFTPELTFFNPASAENKEFPSISNNKPPKVPEPPKASGNTNFRMSKKRPQYYAGPIEGVGAISNSIKPVIPVVDTGSFQGALFTPQVDILAQEAPNTTATPFNINPPTFETTDAPFDINRSTCDTSAPFDISRSFEATTNSDINRQESYPLYESQDNTYNTAFDMSRKITESYENKQESSGFGLIGSLKSKLSSIDINKIQNSVTTFFDPAYNNTKKEDGHQQFTPCEHYGQTQASNFEIFVPNVEQATEAYNQNYNNQMPYQSQHNYGQQNQYYQGQDKYNYYQNTGQNVGNYFLDNSQHYNAPINTSNEHTHSALPATNIQSTFTTTPLNEERKSLEVESKDVTAETKNRTTIPCYSQSNIQDTLNKPEENVQDCCSAVPPYTVNKNGGDQNVTVYSAQNEPQLGAPISSGFFDNQQLQEPHKTAKGEENKAKDTLKDSSKNIESHGSSKNVFESTRLNITQEPQKEISSSVIVDQNDSQIGFFDNRLSHTLQMPSQVNENIAINSLLRTSQLKITEKNYKFDTLTSYFDTPRTNVISTKGEDDNVDTKTSKIVKDVISNVIEENVEQIGQIGFDTQNVSLPEGNPMDFFGSFSSNDFTDQSIFSNFSLEDSECPESSQDKKTKQDEYITDAPELNMSSAPLYGLSTMLADKTKELNDLEDEIRRMSLQEPPKDIDEMFNRSAEVSFFENLETVNDEVKNEVSDLNICETCREVNKPDDRFEVEDLTTQLIENITSPIQLLNPVEVPLPEHTSPSNEEADFNSKQCAEISHITEETIETIQVQSVTEMLDDDQINVRNYGWTEEPYTSSEEHNYSVPYQTKLEKDFNLPINPNVIGFFSGERGLFEKMPTSKDLEPDLKFESPIVLPRQMSIPSAPPQEEDHKSDGLDVHSIEQDAKKDFPIFEEFVIEPEHDFKQSSESLQIDSFTSRVDKYKKKDEVETSEKTSPIFDLNATISPSIPIASYFDTGNYAAETHYRNSLSSPNQIKVPPGFEDEFQRRLSTQDSGDRHDILPPYIPETTTQTRGISSSTFSTAQDANITTVTSSSLPGLILEAGEILTVPDFERIFKKKSITVAKTDLETGDFKAPVNQTVEEHPNLELLAQISKEPIQAAAQGKLSDFADIFGAKLEEKKADTVFEKQIPEVKPEAQKPLQDPLNFFSSNVVEATDKSNEDQGFNRLASYFSSPAKTDTSKSFFELSQSQNHYRQEDNKSYFPPTEPQNTPSNIHNIPPEQFLANMNLMNDLTSYQNVDFIPETVVRNINYFTVEYDNQVLINELNKGEPDFKKGSDVPFKNVIDSETISDESNFRNVIEHCAHCCNLSVGPVLNINNINHDLLTDFKVRKCTDGNNENKKETNMDAPKQNATDTKNTVTVNFDGTIPEENNGISAIATENRSATEYTPVRHHWFYRIDLDGKSTWRGFSVNDSRALEEAFNSPSLNEDTLVATDGGRYDVNVKGRLRFSVYWSDKPSNVRRCSWFYKGTTDPRYVPYTEEVAEKLEEEFRHGMTTGEWHRRLTLPNNELVVMHQPSVMVHFLQPNTSDAFTTPPLFNLGKRVYRNPPKIKVSRDQPQRIDHLVMMVHGAGEFSAQQEKIQSTMRPRVVRRGCDESEIEEVEPSSIDHLLLLCHGVGSACDMKFRNVEEVVNDFRATSLQLIQSHYRNSYDSGVIGRVEVLPISWHATLHSGETGVDKRLARITLDSIPKLRTFTNDTVLDVLFYTSPVFCQTILDTVCNELNRIYKLFRNRNPDFQGGVSLGGHSLGSVILYDLLCHQTPKTDSPLKPEMCDKTFVTGAAGTGQPHVTYPALDFAPTALYALGSPIAIFECIRGVDSLGLHFRLPTCENFFNIFHPYDPIAYRIEPLINPQLRNVKPFLIPHHKGRKRMHLELKETMARVGADIKHKLVESIKSTWSNMWKTQPPPSDRQLEKVVEEEIEKECLTEATKEETIASDETTLEMLGELNSGRRVDYVLQEAPFEIFNEYLFAMSSHVCYWESEDTMLLMLRQIYDALGVQPDSTVPQNSLTVQRVRAARVDEKFSVVVTPTDHPSTSRGSTS